MQKNNVEHSNVRRKMQKREQDDDGRVVNFYVSFSSFI